MNDKITQAISEYHLLAAGDTVVAAVSGGADSVALLHFLCTNAKALGIAVRAAHVNHGIRGEESDGDQHFVESLCSRLHVPLDVFLIPDIFAEAKAAGQGLEEYARCARYAFFNGQAEKYRAKVATAHTQSDSMETTLFNLARGTGLRGLRGIPPVRGSVIRPLILCTRAQVESYCAANRLAYVTDSTNLSDCYARNRIRLRVIPELRRVHSGCDAAYARMARHLSDDDDFLEHAASAALTAAKRKNGWDAASLFALHPAPRYRALAQLLRENSLPCNAAKAELILANLCESRFVLELCAGHFVKIEGGLLTFTRSAPPAPYFEIPVKSGSFSLNDTVSVTFAITNYEHSEQLEKCATGGLKNVLDYGRIYGEFVLRQKRSGDKIRLAQRGLTKSLKKLFCEAGLSPQQRGSTPVLADENGVVWVNGFGCDERVAVTSATKQILTVCIAEEKTP